MKKIELFVIIILVATFVSGCGGKRLTVVYFEPYNDLEEQHSGADFKFKANEQTYMVMTGNEAASNKIIESDENSSYKVIMTDSGNNIVFSLSTEKDYDVDSPRECTDTDGKVYIFYSKWKSMLGRGASYIEDLKSTHILEMDMDNMEVKKQYDYGESIVVISVHDGYVYTMEGGLVYRALLERPEDKECMADLGFRGMPDFDIIRWLGFCTKINGIQVIATTPDKEAEYGYRDIVLADIKYTDEPIEIMESE